MSPERLAEDLVPIAAQLVGTVRDYDPADTGALLDRAGIHDAKARAFVVVLAAMVPPDQSARDLLAWVEREPPRQTRFPREHGTLRGYRQHSYRNPYDPPCAPCRAAHAEDRARRRDGRAVA